MRAVLDTNVVMSAIFFGGVPFDVLNAWHNGEFELVVSEAVMVEYRHFLPPEPPCICDSSNA